MLELRRWIACGVGGCVLAWLPAACAGSPDYLVLQRPPAYRHGKAAGPQPRQVVAQPYPYGYFGAASATPTWGRQFGYNRQYTQWSSR